MQPRSLAEAADREFGSWAAALRAAGLEPDQYLSGPPGPPSARPGKSQPRPGRARDGVGQGRAEPGRRPSPSEAELLEAVAARIRQRRPMTAAAAQVEECRVYRAAVRRFGTWADAVRAAKSASPAGAGSDGADGGPPAG